MSVVKINVIEVPAERGDDMAARFAARVGEVDQSDGFEEFQLLRPDDGRTTWLVYTRGRGVAALDAWVPSASFPRGHARPEGPGGPVASHSELWSFALEQHTAPGTHQPA